MWGLVPPGQFIPILEKNGLITKLDFRVWDMACCLLKRWQQEGRPAQALSVNISPRDFYFADVYRIFANLLRTYEISPGCLHLEITESGFAIDTKRQAELIRRLQALGFIVEMDDFGRGYSSLNILKEMPVDVLKLDMEFMGASAEESRGTSILESVIALGHRLHMPIIAEGVETRQEVDFLRRAGCDIIQGYYYARPMPVQEYEKLMEVWREK